MKQKNEKQSNFKRFFLAAASAVSSSTAARFDMRWFVLDSQNYTITYAKEKGMKPQTIIRFRVSTQKFSLGVPDAGVYTLGLILTYYNCSLYIGYRERE